MSSRKYILILLIFFIAQKVWSQNEESGKISKEQRIIFLYSRTIQLKTGLTFAVVKNKTGFYINGRNDRFKRESEKKTIYDNHWINEQYSATIGYIRKMNKFIDVYGGLGYGYLGYDYLVDDFNANEWDAYINDWGNDSKSYHKTMEGLEIEIGILFHYKFFYANIGVTSLNLQQINPLVGIGLGYKF